MLCYHSMPKYERHVSKTSTSFETNYLCTTKHVLISIYICELVCL